MDGLRTFLADERGETSTMNGLVVGLMIAVLIVLLIVVLQGGFLIQQPQQSPGIDINIRPGTSPAP
jgi:Flp pilus assembly pilin Flp